MIENNDTRYLKQGNWDSTNIVQVKFMKEKEKDVEKIKVSYKLTTTVVFSLIVNTSENNVTEICGSITRNVFIIFINLSMHFRMKNLTILNHTLMTILISKK